MPRPLSELQGWLDYDRDDLPHLSPEERIEYFENVSLGAFQAARSYAQQDGCRHGAGLIYLRSWYSLWPSARVQSLQCHRFQPISGIFRA